MSKDECLENIYIAQDFLDKYTFRAEFSKNEVMSYLTGVAKCIAKIDKL